MDNNNINQIEIKENDINFYLSNGESNNKENNIIDNIQDNNELSQPKIKLKKKVNKLKMPSGNGNIPDNQLPVQNIEIEINNDNIPKNDVIMDNIEKNKENNNYEEKENKGYLDDDLEDEDNKKLYLRVIKRMEKTYGVPVIYAKIEGKPIKEIGLEDNIRPILIGKSDKNQKEIKKNNYMDNRIKNNINKINNNNFKNKENINNNSYNIPNNRINNHINNNYYQDKRQYINNQIYNNNNLINSQNINYNSYINSGLKDPLYNLQPYNSKYNNDLLKKYRYSAGKNFNSINPRVPPYKGSAIRKQRKNTSDKIDKNFQKRLNKKYPIYNPNRIDLGTNKFNYKNLKYYNIGFDFPNFSNFRSLNPRKYNYPLKKTYYISYNNKLPSNEQLFNSKRNKNKNYLNFNSINNTRSPIIAKTNFRYFNKQKNNNFYNFANPLYNNNLGSMNNTNKNIHLNKSQNIIRNKNNLYNYTGYLNKYNYGRNNNNLLSLTQEIMGRSNEKYNMAPFHSFNNFHLNFNYANEDNINNDYYTGFEMPKKEIKFTYYINSRYN